MIRKRRYETLDALRGVAALVVVVFHLSQVKLEGSIFPGGYLAVDFFFILSGFVLALAYEEPLQKRMSWSLFAVKRVLRLYPLALLGALLGLLVLLLKWHTAPEKVDSLPRIVASGVTNGLMLPTFFGSSVSRFETFPGNGPLWTLFFEMLANLLWARFMAGARTAVLCGVIIFSAALLSVLAVAFHTANLGFDERTFLGGLARVSFGFPLGVLIFRSHERLDFGEVAYAPVLLGLALLTIFACPWNVAGGVPWRDLLGIIVLLPLIVILGIGHNGSSRVGSSLGVLSYPIYVLHFPILALASGMHQTVLRQVNVHIVALGASGLALFMAVIATRYYDEPIRKAFSHTAVQVVLNRAGRPVAPETQQ